MVATATYTIDHVPTRQGVRNARPDGFQGRGEPRFGITEKYPVHHHAALEESQAMYPIVQKAQRLHRIMGRWYWFWAVCLGLATAHMIDHLVAAALNTTPISDVVVGNGLDTTGFTLWHGINSITDYASLVVVAALLVGRPMSSASRRGFIGWGKEFRRRLGKWWWPFAASFGLVTFHMSDHVQAILFTNTLLSDTFFANSVSHQGFLFWHALNTVLAFFLLVLLTWILARDSPLPKVGEIPARHAAPSSEA